MSFPPKVNGYSDEEGLPHGVPPPPMSSVLALDVAAVFDNLNVSGAAVRVCSATVSEKMTLENRTRRLGPAEHDPDVSL